MSSELGVEEQKIRSVCRHKSSPLFDERERTALRYADAITFSDQDVDDELYKQVQSHFNEDEVVELTTYIAWENCSSKFNRALRIESQELWQPADKDQALDK